MKTKRMSFSNIKDVLTRDEMRSIMAGSDDGASCKEYECPDYPNKECYRTLEDLLNCRCSHNDGQKLCKAKD